MLHAKLPPIWHCGSQPHFSPEPSLQAWRRPRGANSGTAPGAMINRAPENSNGGYHGSFNSALDAWGSDPDHYSDCYLHAVNPGAPEEFHPFAKRDWLPTMRR